MTHIRLWNSCFHEHGSGSWSRALGFPPAPDPELLVFLSVALATELSFFMAPGPASASVRFHTLIFPIVLVCLKLNENEYGNSHHPQMTFKSILFGEAIRLRCFNQRKDDYLSSLNRLKEKAIRSKFPLNMTNNNNNNNNFIFFTSTQVHLTIQTQ